MKIGDKVRISPSSQYAHQHSGVGVISSAMYELEEGWVTVTFDDGYTNNYSTEEDLELVNQQMLDPEMSLDEISEAQYIYQGLTR